MKVNFKNVLKFWIGLSICLLSYSIIKLANSLVSVNKNIPGIVTQVSNINQRVDSITGKTIPDILKLVPPIIAQVDSIQAKIPMIMDETKSLQTTTIPSVLKEVDLVRREIPAILRTVDSINKQVPEIQNMVASVTQSVNESLMRVDSLNQQVPYILSTINTTNDSVASYLNQTERIIANADEVAKTAAKNASIGFLGGIVASPFNMVKKVGNFVFSDKSKLTQDDALGAEEQLVLFLNQNLKQKEHKWESSRINKSGSITVLRTYIKKGRKIKKIKVRFDDPKESIVVHYVQGTDGKWYFWK